MPSRMIPVFRIFDYPKAVEFYVQWLGFAIDWEHIFGKNFPRYLQISRGNLVMHFTDITATRTMEVTDPFGNKILFSDSHNKNV